MCLFKKWSCPIFQIRRNFMHLWPFASFFFLSTHVGVSSRQLIWWGQEAFWSFSCHVSDMWENLTSIAQAVALGIESSVDRCRKVQAILAFLALGLSSKPVLSSVSASCYSRSWCSCPQPRFQRRLSGFYVTLTGPGDWSLWAAQKMSLGQLSCLHPI